MKLFCICFCIAIEAPIHHLLIVMIIQTQALREQQAAYRDAINKERAAHEIVRKYFIKN